MSLWTFLKQQTEFLLSPVLLFSEDRCNVKSGTFTCDDALMFNKVKILLSL